MERRKGRRGRGGGWLALCLSYTLQLTCAADLSYSVSEELQAGSVVGNLAKDLEMDVRRIAERNLRVVRDSATQYFEVDAASGTLVIREPVDRERICAQSSACFLHLQIVLEDPLEMKRATVEIADVNDNAPQFLADNITLEVSEAAAPGASFRLEGAHDPDVGVNSLRTYMLSPNECFALNVLSKSDGTKFPELVLEKPLDREKQATFRLLLTAVDGGRPERSGTTVVNVKVLDVNDNAPVFEQPVLKVSLAENTPVGTVVAQLNATDVDAGPNGEISFLFSKYTPDAVLRIFSVDPHKGEVKVIGELDYEAAAAYDITVQARDNGNPAMEGSCNIKVEVKDVNDNAPQVSVTSLTSPVREDVAPGTVIAFLKVSDADSGKNGEVTLRIPAGLPFRLTSPFKEHYTVVTDGPLDREAVAEHIIVVTATDGGNPALTAQTRLAVSLSDVNDNAPTFSQPSYSVDVLENNSPGALLLTLSASDPDAGENSRLSFFMLPGSVQGSPLFSFMSMDSESGRIHATRSLDHEEHSLIRFEVQVRDAGSPPRSSNVTVHVFVIDQNDNAPVILYPPEPRTLRLPRTASAGYLVGKITGLDTDSGYNAWLGYSIAPGPHAAHFRIDRYSGELRTVRRLEEEEELEEGSTYSLVVVVKDNGEPSLSTNATITITVEEPSSNSATNTRQTSGSSGLGDITLYLIISLACVSAVAVLTAAVLLVRCLRRGCEDPDWDSWHCGRRKVRSRHHTQQRAQKNLHLQLNTDGPIKYVEVVGGPAEAHTRTYRPCYSTLSSRSDFVFVKTPMMSHNNTLSMTLTRKPLPSMLSEQKPPNTDWRFSQNQRPGPSGRYRLTSPQFNRRTSERMRAAAAVGGPPEAAAVGTGPWPNPPTEAEQLQALMAAANEVSEATATLGPGTMGLSTRYSPQFTLQHVPDYRQNVYIPGSTATLTANPPQQALPPPQQAPPPAQAEAPKAAQTPASKKKSAKKEKK